ncbi:MAG: OmpA family protein, partial [Bacteroidota bacterium]
DNRGYLKKVKVVFLDLQSNQVFADTISNRKGQFEVNLPANKIYRVIADKKHFFQLEDTISTLNQPLGEKLFVKLELERKPGYIFDVTLAEANHGAALVNAVQGARIEVFNNTNQVEELVLKDYPYPNFKFTFEHGNHYTFMIRKQGYFNKRIEAYVNVEGCILCFDGLGLVEPGVTDVLSNGHKIGTFLANVDLEPIEINKTFTLDNIYYDYNKANIRPDAAMELDRLVGVLKDNPGVKIELGAHTDARGRDKYNLDLSQRRAQAAVDYLVTNGGIDDRNITSKGYGEAQLVNGCGNGVACAEEKHQKNRRTELKITGIEAVDPLSKRSLKEILLEEKLVEEVLNSKVIQVSKNQ